MTRRAAPPRALEASEDEQIDEVSDKVSPGVLRLGSIVRELRQRNSMTLADLASRSKLSIGLLSRLENGIGNPSLATLTRLSSAFGVHIAVLFDDPTEKYFGKVSRHERIEVTVPEIGVRHFLLQTTLNPRFVVSLVTLSPDGGGSPAHQHRGTEFVSVLSGCVVLSVDDERYVLRRGDSATYSASKAHALEPQGRSEATLFYVASPARLP